jgi:hypothetical protein
MRWRLVGRSPDFVVPRLPPEQPKDAVQTEKSRLARRAEPTSIERRRRRGSSSDQDAPWRIHFFKRHADDDSSELVPARDFLQTCPTKVKATILAVVSAVAEAPPPAFGGGGKWEAMHDEMAGFYEVRVDGPQRRHYRLFCILERDGAAVGLGGPSLVLIAGKT